MSTNVEDLDDAAIEAAQAAEDEANGNLEAAEPDDEQPEGEAQAAVADEDAAAESEQPKDAPKVAGVASKDGAHVLPYAALQAERRAARSANAARERAEQEAAALRQQIEDLKAGKTTEAATDADELSEEELAAVAEDFPQVAKVAKQVKQLREQLSKLTPQQQAQQADAEPADDPVQEAIDSVPLLLEWQTSDPEKFARAQAIDSVTKSSPKWANKPLHERFAHVAKQVADEFDIPFETSPRSTPAPNKADPRRVVQSAARTAPNTLSDLKGGATDQGDVRIEKLPPAAAMARMSKMTDAEIERHLAKFG